MSDGMDDAMKMTTRRHYKGKEEVKDGKTEGAGKVAKVKAKRRSKRKVVGRTIKRRAKPRSRKAKPQTLVGRLLRLVGIV